MSKTYFQRMLDQSQANKTNLQTRESHLPSVIAALQGVGNSTANKLADQYTAELAGIPAKIAEIDVVIADLND